MSQAAFLQAITAAVDAKSIVTDGEAIEPWLTDWRGRWHGRSPALMQPASTAEVQAIVCLAAKHGVPLVPQGGNTSMVGGATPPADGSAVLLSLRRMNTIRAIAPDRVVAEAGVILESLHAAAAEIGRRFPLTLGAKGSCTIGGLVSTNAGGTQVLRFGTMRALVQGLEAVLPDGSIHDGLAALKKDNRGYDLDQLLIGAEGTLGVVTAATLTLVAAPAARAVAWIGLADPAAALALLRRAEGQGVLPEAFELIPADSLAAVLSHIPGTRAPLTGAHPWHALVELTAGADEEAPDERLERLLGPELGAGRIADAAIAASEAQADDFWRIRHSISEAERSLGPATQHDISVPVDAMPEFIIAAGRAVEAAFPGCRATAFGHLGDGNVHFHVRAPADALADWVDSDGPAINRFVDDRVTAVGGSISAEHGIGQMKIDELERLAAPSRLHALRAIKRAMDPLGLMNPGKLVR